MNSFIDDTNFLERYGFALQTLEEPSGARIALLPGVQGRVATSSWAGPGGVSLGWINRELIASGEKRPHINAYGGEDRFWIGPEGGQFSPFFAPESEFDYAHWQVPACIDDMPWQSIGTPDPRREAAFSCFARVVNHRGFVKELLLTRHVRILSRAELSGRLGLDLDELELDAVGYTTVNSLFNSGDEAWTRQNGALSIWVLGMFPAGDATKIIAPCRADAEIGLKADYFGAIPPERLTRDELNRRVLFTADGGSRGKIGFSPAAATGRIGSYDPENRLLTLTICAAAPDPGKAYVNSAWQEQSEPFNGDAINAYNDGPTDGGGQLGKFYELESSSPAAFLAPGSSITHAQTTLHLHGSAAALDQVAAKQLNGALA